MPTYSYQRPVKAIDGLDEKYRNDHLKYFFESMVYKNIISLSTEEKERYFRFQKDYEWLFQKIFGNLDEDMSDITYLPTALKKGIKNPLVDQYKEWLEKQND